MTPRRRRLTLIADRTSNLRAALRLVAVNNSTRTEAYMRQLNYLVRLARRAI